jgi:amino acid transporter
VKVVEEQPAQATQPQLARTLGLREGIAIQMGMIIGSGIFIVPATIASRLHAMGPILHSHHRIRFSNTLF